MSERELRNLHKKAKQRVIAKKGFYIHFGIYVIISIFLFLINLLADPSDYWFYYPVLSWGIAVAIQYFVTFGVPGSDILSQEWEERELEREMYILQRQEGMIRRTTVEDYPDSHEEMDELELREPVRAKKNWDQDLV